MNRLVYEEEKYICLNLDPQVYSHIHLLNLEYFYIAIILINSNI